MPAIKLRHKSLPWGHTAALSVPWLLLALTAFSAQAQTAVTPQPVAVKPVQPLVPVPSEPQLLVLELQLDGSQLSNAFTAYESGNDVLLPVGELARLLSLGVTVDTASRTASGFLLRENRTFRLELDSARVLLGNGSAPVPVDPALLHWADDELYVSSRLLQVWWPLDFELKLSSLMLKVQPRETLPIQARLARERSAAGLRVRAGMDPTDLGYPLANNDFSFFSTPFIDQTLGVDVKRSSDGQNTTSSAYSALLTGDLLGMEANLYLSSSKGTSADARFSLSRHDPQPDLLGPLRARSVSVGNVSLPTLNHVMRSGVDGNALLLSNRPLNQSTSYGLHRLTGELPPGWDVTLYFNEALIGFQQARPDGLYVFDDQVLVFGRNEFRLVFNGPLGQTRVEREVFLLDQTLSKPGELIYTVGTYRADNGASRQMAQFDLGLAQGLAATVGLVGAKKSLSSTSTADDDNAVPRTYTNLGLRASTSGWLLSAEMAHAEGGGKFGELGLRTNIDKFSIDVTHTRFDQFVSDFYAATSDPLRVRDRVRINGAWSVPGIGLTLPVGLDVFNEVTEANRRTLRLQNRLSLNLEGTSYTNTLNWQSTAGQKSASGTLQLSRRVAGIGVSSQLAYNLKPTAEFGSWALSADKGLEKSARLKLGLVRNFSPGLTSITAGYTRNFGRFGLGVSGSYDTNGTRSVGVQLFMALGRDPRNARWVGDWQPMANAGAVSARVFLDENMNGRFDADDVPVEGASFLIGGGGRHAVRTDASGTAYLSRLAPKAYTDVALDTATLEDPQWQPLVNGVRVLPRPGKVHQLDFPVVMTGEVDGTVSLQQEKKSQGIGNATVELVNERGEVVASTLSSSDGFYIIFAVKPGRYTVRINPEQLEKLGLQSNSPIEMVMKKDGEFVSGMDFLLRKKP